MRTPVDRLVNNSNHHDQTILRISTYALLPCWNNVDYPWTKTKKYRLKKLNRLLSIKHATITWAKKTAYIIVYRLHKNIRSIQYFQTEIGLVELQISPFSN